jgi:cysteine desulfurase
MSGHKIHAIKGSGALFCRKGTILKPLLFGGGQQNSIRPGTENTPGISSIAAAAMHESKNLKKTQAEVSRIRDALASLADEMEDVFVNGGFASDYILNMSFLGVKGETLTHALAEKGIFASTGSACGARSKHKSQLAKLGLPLDRQDSAVRFSFSSTNTLDEALIAKAAIRSAAESLRASLRRRV